jgi:hypothetical protein
MRWRVAFDTEFQHKNVVINRRTVETINKDTQLTAIRFTANQLIGSCSVGSNRGREGKMGRLTKKKSSRGHVKRTRLTFGRQLTCNRTCTDVNIECSMDYDIRHLELGRLITVDQRFPYDATNFDSIFTPVATETSMSPFSHCDM